MQPMQRWRDALIDAACAFAASRVIVIVTLAAAGRLDHRYADTWDAGYYTTITAFGYGDAALDPATLSHLPAFFPLTPLVLKALAGIGLDPLLAGPIVMTLSSLAALVVLHVLVREGASRRVARLSVAAIAFFPFSYVLSTNYSDGLFLLTSVSAYYAVTRRQPLVAFVAAAGAGLDRPAALALGAAFAWEALRPGRRRRAALAGALGVAIGTGAFFLYLWHVRGTPLASLDAQREWQRTGNPVDLVPYVWHSLTGLHATNLLYLVGVPLGVLGILVLRRTGITGTPLAFAVFALVLPLASGTAMSLPRFLMGTFPFAWAAGLVLDRLPARTVRIVLGLAALGLVGLTVWTYRTPIGGGLAP